MDEELINKYEKIKEWILFFLLGIWLLIPNLKEITVTWNLAYGYEFTFIKFMGAVGVGFFVIDIFKNLKYSKDKKAYDRELAPVTILGIFMIWTFISAVFSENKTNAFFGDVYRKEGYVTYIAYVGFFASTFLIKSKRKKKIILNMFILMVTSNIIMLELANKDILVEIFAKRALNRSVFLNSNHYGYYLLLATATANFLFITQKNKYIKVVYILLYSFLVYYLILNDTFGVYLALALTLILFTIYCILKKEKRCISILSIIIFMVISVGTQQTKAITQNNINSFVKDIKNIVAASQIKDKTDNNENKQTITNNKETGNKITTNTTTNKPSKEEDKIIQAAEKAGTNRMRLWKNGVKFFLEKPILGYGPENLKDKYWEVGVINRDRPHNLLIQLATTSGVIGLISYVTAIGIILIRGLKRMKMENDIHVISFFTVIAYLISAMFGNSMYYTSPYFFIFLGLLMTENINTLETKNN